MQLLKILQSQGFGSKKSCLQMIKNGVIKIDNHVLTDPKIDLPINQLTLEIDGKYYPYYPNLIIALNKPAGYECSRQPSHHASIHSLIPAHFNYRGIQCAGRLDQDTTGLIILADDGGLIHNLTHPKKHLPKTYKVKLSDPLQLTQLKQLTTGVELRQEKGLFFFDNVQLIGDAEYLVVINQGVYHQIKRMFAAVGSHVNDLERIGIGSLTINKLNLKVGEYTHLTEVDLALLLQ